MQKTTFQYKTAQRTPFPTHTNIDTQLSLSANHFDLWKVIKWTAVYKSTIHPSIISLQAGKFNGMFKPQGVKIVLELLIVDLASCVSMETPICFCSLCKNLIGIPAFPGWPDGRRSWCQSQLFFENTSFIAEAHSWFNCLWVTLHITISSSWIAVNRPSLML